MNNFEIIFKSYGEAMDKEMERYIEKIGRNGNEPQEGDIESVLNNILKKWLDTPLDEIDGMPPREFITQIGTLEEAIEAFKSFLIAGEGIIPDVLRSKLEEFGDTAVDALLDLLVNDGMTADTDDNSDFHPYFYVKQGIISLMGIWKAESGIPALVQVIRNSNDKDEFLAEASIKALAEIGAPAIPELIEAAKSVSGNILVNILDALTQIGGKGKDDRVYPVLKEYFLNGGNRDMALVFFLQLNDSRAIAFLRGYIEKNADKIGYREYSSLERCIEELGGNTDDIQIDFSNDPEYQQYLKMIEKYSKIGGEKTGRNDPCPCGSGKKYKKCCGK